MKGKSAAIRRCRQLGVSKETRKVSGLWSLPDAVVLTILAELSRLDLAALAIASKAHRSLVVSPQLLGLRRRTRCTEPYLYVYLHILPEPIPRWFILHPVQRRLKPIYSHLDQSPESSSSFVVVDWGIYMIGGLVNGKPTKEVWFLHCFRNKLFRIQPMKMARASPSASRIGMKIYVFGGCGDSSNRAEVFDINTHTWDFLDVPTSLPKNIRQSVVVIGRKEEVYGVDEEGQSFSFSPCELPVCVSSGKTVSKPGDDWCLIGEFLFCRGTGGRILWCLPDELDWKEVKGLEKLQHSLSPWRHKWGLPDANLQFDISKLCLNSASNNIVIFWNACYAQPQGADSWELWSAEISLWKTKDESKGLEITGKIEWSGAVYKLTDKSCCSFKVLFAAPIYA